MLVRSYKDVAAIPVREGVKKRVVIGPKEGVPNFVMRVFDQAPGASSNYHSHDWEHEVFVLTGEGTLVTKDGEIPLKANDVAYVAPHEKHCLTNHGQDTFRFICLVPLRAEGVDTCLVPLRGEDTP